MGQVAHWMSDARSYYSILIPYINAACAIKYSNVVFVLRHFTMTYGISSFPEGLHPSFD